MVVWPGVQVWALESGCLNLNLSSVVDSCQTKAEAKSLVPNHSAFFFTCETGAVIIPVFESTAWIKQGSPFTVLKGESHTQRLNAVSSGLQT